MDVSAMLHSQRKKIYRQLYSAFGLYFCIEGL